MPELTGKTILIVDDDPDVVTAITMTLQDQGSTVVAAEDGVQAVDVAEQQHPDLIILDMMLPKRSGFLVLERLKTKSPSPRSSAITGNLGSRHKSYAETHGRRRLH